MPLPSKKKENTNNSKKEIKMQNQNYTQNKPYARKPWLSFYSNETMETNAINNVQLSWLLNLPSVLQQPEPGNLLVWASFVKSFVV